MFTAGEPTVIIVSAMAIALAMFAALVPWLVLESRRPHRQQGARPRR